jgi:SAM-dependent methyltransferase
MQGSVMAQEKETLEIKRHDKTLAAESTVLVSKPPAPDSLRRVGIEFRKCFVRWQRDGLMERYLSGEHILDIGYKGGDPDAVPVTESAIGIGLEYPGYDGTHLPFDDQTQDAVFASAVLEHIPNYRQALAEWYRVTKIGGYVIIFVPNRYLYEMRPDLPGRWNGDHRRFYTPASLLQEIEQSLPINGFRVRHLLDNDEGFNYGDPQGSRPRGNYQIETVVQRIDTPSYSHRLVYPDHLRRMVDYYDKIIIECLDQALTNGVPSDSLLGLLGRPRFPCPNRPCHAWPRQP